MSRSNLTKHCACHEERLVCFIPVPHEPSFTMRGTTIVTLQPDQILHLPRKMTRLLNPGHFKCAEQQVSPSTLTKYCPCHEKWHIELHQILRLTAKWLACLLLVPHEMSFTMRGTTIVTLQPGQILRLPRRKTRMLNPRHIWNVIYNVRSNRCHDPTSPNTDPATKNDTTKFQRNFPKTGETSFTICRDDRTMIRKWNRQSATPRNRVTLRACHKHFLLKNTTLRAPAIIQKFTKCCTCHEKSHLNFTKCCACHESDTWTSPSAAPATKVTLELHQVLHLPRKVALELHQLLRLPRIVTRELHQLLRLPRKVTHELHLYCTLFSILLYSTLLYSVLLYSTLLYFTLLTLLYFTLLYCTLLYLLLYSTLGYSTLLYSTLLSCLRIGSFSAKLPLIITRQGYGYCLNQ